MPRFLRLILVFLYAGHFMPPASRPFWLRVFVFASSLFLRPTLDAKAKRMSDHIVCLGAPYIKIGQFLALRPDILGEDLAHALARLHDDVPAFGRAEAVAAVERAFSRPIGSIFSYFSEPVATASVAQVHAAELNGQRVAVKVVRPGLKRDCEKSFRLLRRCVKLTEFFFPALRCVRLQNTLDTLAKSLDLEMNMRMEGAAIVSVKKDNARASVSIAAPEVVWEWVSESVLTTSWVDGESLSSVFKSNRSYRSKNLARQLVQAFLIQVLENGFFHADLHPGNLFLQGGGKEDTVRLVAVDFGLMGCLSLSLRLFLGRVMMGFIQRDYEAVASAYVREGYIRPEQRAQFKQALHYVGEPIVGKDSKNISLPGLLNSLFRLMRQFEIPLHQELILLHKSMVTVESVAYRIDPEHNFWDISKPIVDAWMHRTFSLKSQLARFSLGLREDSFLERWANVPEILGDIKATLLRASDGKRHPSWFWLLFLASGASVCLSLLVLTFFLRLRGG